MPRTAHPCSHTHTRARARTHQTTHQTTHARACCTYTQSHNPLLRLRLLQLDVVLSTMHASGGEHPTMMNDVIRIPCQGAMQTLRRMRARTWL